MIINNVVHQAFQTIIKYFDNPDLGQLRMFLTGEGGTGKSKKIIELVMEYIYIYICMYDLFMKK